MATIQLSRNCSNCGKRTLHSKEKFSTLWGIVLSALTMGLFLLVWVPAIIVNAFKPYRCQQCGKSRRT